MAAVLLLSVVVGWRDLGAVEDNLGTAFARNATQLNKQRILAPVGRELVLSQRLADSEVTRRWLLDEKNPAKKALFFAEAERYQTAFTDKSYFAISRDSRHYYFNDDKSPFSDHPKYSQLATNMDVGLAYVDLEQKTVIFSGAKVSLYWCDGQEVGEAKGDRVAIGGKRSPTFCNRVVPLQEQTTFYLTTDGLLDKAGGPKGYSFGQTHFNHLLLRLAEQPVPDQGAAFGAELDKYRGNLAQRDDITVMGFRFAV